MAPMIRQFCKVKHDPENGTYGDCLRACVATMLGHDVPHFFEDGCDGETGHKRLRDYLMTLNLSPFTWALDADQVSKDALFEFMRVNNTNINYLLFCRCGGEDHAVVCRDGAVVHNPAWAPYPVSGPNSSGVWLVMVFCAS